MIADNLPALIAYLSADERYLFVNARSEQMFGLAPEQMVGRQVAEVMSPPPTRKLRRTWKARARAIAPVSSATWCATDAGGASSSS